MFLLLFVKEEVKRLEERGKRHGDLLENRVGWAKHGEDTDEERYRGTRENTGRNIRKAGKVLCEPGLVRKRQIQRAEQGNWSSKEPAEARQGKERQAIYRAGGKRQGAKPASQGEGRRWREGQEQEDGVNAGKGELNRRVEAKGAGR